MAVPPTYTRSVRAAPARLPNVDPDAYGVGAARAVGAVGEQMLQIARLEDQRDVQAKMADRAAAMAKLQAELRAEIDTMRQNAGPGAAGHEEAVGNLIDKRVADFMGTIDDRRVLQALTPDVARIAGGAKVDEQRFAVGMRVKKQVDDYEVAERQFGANVYADYNGTNQQTALSALYTTIDSTSMPADHKEKLRQSARRTIHGAAWQGFRQDDPEGALALIDEGFLNEDFSADEIVQLRRTAEADVARARVAADREAAKLVAAQKDEEETVLARVGDGVDYDPAELGAMAARAAARGDSHRADQLREAQVTALAVAPYRAASAVQITGALARIEADPKWRTSADKVRMHTALSRLRDERRTEEPNIAPPNWTDPASIDAYERAMRVDAAERQMPVPTYLSKDMRAQLAPMMETPGGRREVLGLLSRMSQPAAFSAARELAPNDRVFQLAATLPDHARTLALSGRDALATNPDLAPPAAVTMAFNRRAAIALRGFDTDMSRAAREVAAAITAAMLSNAGQKRWDPDTFEQATTIALGGGYRGGQQLGGIGSWRRQPILLPDDMSQPEFDRRLSRLSGPANAYAGGRQLDWATLRRNYSPLAVGDGQYHFVDAQGRPVMARNGTPSLLDIRKVR
ncbi:hypothetical protein ACMT1E_04320 [Sphingomonas flavalba]|uniref:hypothetical protein n=1 Tax=Sphingomonas flavalba TaxID=2559804 RepID=UPI0039E0AC9E